MLTILVCAAVIVALLKITVLDSPDIMCMVAEGFDEPSTLYYASIERIYKISEKKNVGEKFIEHLIEGENQHLQNCYIRVLGVIGEKDAIYNWCVDISQKFTYTEGKRNAIADDLEQLYYFWKENKLEYGCNPEKIKEFNRKNQSIKLVNAIKRTLET